MWGLVIFFDPNTKSCLEIRLWFAKSVQMIRNLQFRDRCFYRLQAQFNCYDNLTLLVFMNPPPGSNKLVSSGAGHDCPIPTPIPIPAPSHPSTSPTSLSSLGLPSSPSPPRLSRTPALPAPRGAGGSTHPNPYLCEKSLKEAQDSVSGRRRSTRGMMEFVETWGS